MGMRNELLKSTSNAAGPLRPVFYFCTLMEKENTHHIYCISGLGGDFRIFKNIHIRNAQLHPINWTMPLPGETMQSFAQKLSGQIKHPDPILLGVSFGGMLATEMSRLIPVKKTIVISSCKMPGEISGFIKVAGRLSMHRYIPYWKFLHNNNFNRFFFDVHSNEEELYIKRLMLNQSKIDFVRRCVDLILNWKTQGPLPENLVHIHGHQDRLLTPKKVKADYWINDGGHFMIWNRANEINQIIENELGKMEKPMPKAGMG